MYKILVLQIISERINNQKNWKNWLKLKELNLFDCFDLKVLD